MIVNDRISVNHRNKDFDKKSNVYLRSSLSAILFIALFIYRFSIPELYVSFSISVYQ